MEGLRPLGAGEMRDAAFRIYRSRFKSLILAVIIPTFPLVVISTLVAWSTRPTTEVDPATGMVRTDVGDAFVSIAGGLVTVVVAILSTSIATAACYRAISGAYLGDDATWRESLRFAVNRLWPVIGLTILTGLATLLGLLALVIGILVPTTFFAVAMPVLLVEGHRPADAMRRSWDLVRGTAWRVLGLVLMALVLSTVFQSVVSAPAVALVFTDSSTVVTEIVTGLSQFLAVVLVTPFTAAFTMALYVDLRVRKEGFDLVLWAQRLGIEARDGFPTQPGAPSYPQFPGLGGLPPPPPPPPPPAPPHEPPPPPPPARPPGAGGGAGSVWAPGPDD